MVYPNPTRAERVNIYSNQAAAQLIVFDQQGRRVRQFSGWQEVSLQGLSAGLYLVQLQNASYHSTERLIVE